MVLTRWDPLFEIRRAHRLANRRRTGFPTAFANGNEQRDWSIPLDIVRDGENVTVKASLPGFAADDIDVTVESGLLTISADTKVEEERKEGGYVIRELRSGSFHRSLRLSEHVDADKAELNYESGVLTIKLPVAESKKAKHLKVGAGAALTEAQ